MPPLIIPEQYDISIEFTEELSLHQVVSLVSEMPKPHVILWYIGTYGLKTPCVDFYRDNLISPFLINNLEITFWLVDLVAWHAFKSPKGSIYKTSSCCSIIKNFNDHRINCLSSSEIFQRMLEITDNHVIDHFTKVFEKILTQNIGGGQPIQGITVGDICTQNFPVLNALINVDVSRAYSAIQYLEGCLIIEKIIKEVTSNSKERIVELVFALPNDELKYYNINDVSFRKSVEILIIKALVALNIDQIQLNIKFYSFQFGEKKEHRPYNAPGHSIKRNKLLIEDVIGNENTRLVAKEKTYAFGTKI